MQARQRKTERIAFARGFPAIMTSLDGSWQRPCTMDDVSDGGARLTLIDPPEGLDLTEFILLLSANGRAFRHCELRWTREREIGVRFVSAERGRRLDGRAGPVPRSLALPVVEI